MDPSTGTFISVDSYAGTIYDPVSLHKYLYANADPINNTDPSGNMTMTEAIGSLAIAAILTVAMISVMSQFKENTLKSGPIIGFPYNLRRDLEKMIEAFPAYKEELGNLIEIIPRIILEIKIFEIIFKTCIYTVLIEIFPATSEKEPIFITIESDSEPVDVKISKKKYPESAKHKEEAVKNGQPDTLTIDRKGASERRKKSLQGVDTIPGSDRDEYPPRLCLKKGEKGQV